MGRKLETQKEFLKKFHKKKKKNILFLGKQNWLAPQHNYFIINFFLWKERRGAGAQICQK